MPLIATSAAWIDREACSASECARLRISRSPCASAIDRASTAFQTTSPSTHAVITTATAATITAGANGFGVLGEARGRSVGSTGVVLPPVINAPS